MTDTERLELKGLSVEEKSRLKYFADSHGVSMSEYVRNLINRELEQDEFQEIEDTLTEEKENPTMEVKHYDIEPPSFATEAEKRIYKYVREETKKILKDNPRYLTVSNLFVAEYLVSCGYRCQKVIGGDPVKGTPKKWLLIKSKDVSESNEKETQEQ